MLIRIQIIKFESSNHHSLNGKKSKDLTMWSLSWCSKKFQKDEFY